MRKITKGLEPVELTAWKRKNPKHKKYDDLSHIERQAINEATRSEQFGLCAYCCDMINEENSMNEHVEAQSLNQNRTLDFNNIVASCTTRGRCDKAHQSQPLPLTPLMTECETELRFEKSGAVNGLTTRATEAIRVLGLDTKAIREERKRIILSFLFEYGLNEEKLLLIGDELLADLLADFQQPKNGQLQPYSPILINILKQYLAHAL
jgi:uncharacterized protein (TIGR02646 family)